MQRGAGTAIDPLFKNAIDFPNNHVSYSNNGQWSLFVALADNSKILPYADENRDRNFAELFWRRYA